MVALQTREGEPVEGSPCTSTDPAQILSILDQAMQDPDATVPRLRLLRQALEDGYVTDVTEENLAWIERFLSSRPCMYVVPAFEEPEEHNKHGEGHPTSDPAIDLAKQQLDDIGWGQLDGNRILDPDDLIEQHGALSVLYAVWCSKGKAIRNRPGFVTWWLKQGHEVPTGWMPTELRKTAQENAQNGADTPEALSPTLEPQTSPEPKERPYEALELPQTPVDLRLLREELLAHVEPLVRPASFEAWIKPPALVAVDGMNRLILQAPDSFHAEWVNKQFAKPLQQACQAMGYGGFYCTWQPRRVS